MLNVDAITTHHLVKSFQLNASFQMCQCLTLYETSKLIIGSEENIYILDLNQASWKHTLKGHTEWVRFVNVLEHLASSSWRTAYDESGCIKIWCLRKFVCLRTLKCSSNVLCLEWYSCQSLLSGFRDGRIFLWDFQQNNEQQEEEEANQKMFLDHLDAIFCLKRLHERERNLFASGSRDGSIKIWNVSSGERIQTLLGHLKSVFDLEIIDNKSMLLSCSSDETIRLWNLSTFECVLIFEGQTDWIRKIRINSRLNRVISLSDDKTIRI